MCFYSLDGHHKLIRWRFVTHGCIDGYSRMITFIECSTNNRGDTVYNLFLEAATKYGLPSRIRCDYGGENIRVAAHMLQHHGLNRNSVITGSSTHNQRIERLWSDVHRSVTKMYYRLFYFLEYHGLLDPLNEMHIFALHFVYLPRIRRSIKLFAAAWNNHGLRTMHHSSPGQLFVSGCLRLRHSGLVALDFLDSTDGTYGVDGADDEDDYSLIGEQETSVQVPESRVQLSSEQVELLTTQVDPLSRSDNYAIEKYERALSLLHGWFATF